MEKKPLILWADDEIDLLRPHILFLQNHGYEMLTVNNGVDAIDTAFSNPVDLIILDEHMPGISGLKTLSIIKEKMPHIPVIMITKSEEEDIMNQAIGSKIADYLIKPVNPRQILSSIKKYTERERLVSQMAANRYIGDFREIDSMIGECNTFEDWKNLYARLTYWQVELSINHSAYENLAGMKEMAQNQIMQAEKVFFRYTARNYISWLNDDTVIMSKDILKQKLLPLLDAGELTWFILIDNFRLDQWYVLRNMMSELFRIEEDISCSILPTTTQYARNSIFSGLMPADIKKLSPEMWVEEKDTESKNNYEAELLNLFFRRNGRKVDFFYTKLTDSSSCNSLLSSFNEITSRQLKVVVVNFIDMLSHERTRSKAVRELSATEAGFRALTESWFRHSPIVELFRKIASAGEKIILTTDHGTIKVNRPVKIFADRNTSDTLRYKIGKNLKFEGKDILEVNEPAKIGLPVSGIASSFLFAGGGDYFVYHNNYNQFVHYYNDTYQHGGISMQEMLTPLVTLIPK